MNDCLNCVKDGNVYNADPVPFVVHENMRAQMDAANLREEELHDAECYAKMALEYRDEYPELARVVNNLSAQEMDHMTSLHGVVVQLIDQYRRTNGEPPAEMKAVYDFLHKKHIDHAAAVNVLRSMYKG